MKNRLIAAFLILTVAAMPAVGAVPNQYNPNTVVPTGIDSTTGNAVAPFIDHATGGITVAAPASVPLPTNITTASNVVDTANSTTTPLAASGVFTGGWTNTLSYTQVEVSLLTDQVATLQIQFSNNGTTVAHQHSYVVTGGVGKTVQIQPHGQYYRVNFINGATPEASINLLAVLKPVPSPGTIIEANDVITNSDDAALVKSIITGSSVDGTGYKNVLTTPDGGLVINQNTQIDTGNSTTANLAPGASFVGAWSSDLSYTAFQYGINADQNFSISIDQSPDGVNADITDTYEYFHALGGSGNTVQLVESFHRIRITNIGTATTTHLRLQAIKVPFLPSLPRSLSLDGYLQVAANHVEDDSGFTQYYTPFGEQVSVPLFRLTGSVFNGNALDANFWTAASGVGGTVAPTNGFLTLSTGTTSNNSVSVQSVYIGRFVAGEPHKFRTLLKLGDTGTVNNVRRWGTFTSGPTDGAFFELNGTTLNLVTCVATTCSRVANGTFNGNEGNQLVLDTNSHFYEIVFTPAVVFFYYDNELIHTQQFPTGPWSSTLDLPIRMENINSGGSTTNVSMFTSAAVLLRMGLPATQPVSKFQSGTTAGVTLKTGSGNLHGCIISNVTNNAVVTLYDNTAASGTTIWSSGAMGAQTIPFSLDFKGIEFNTGLTETVTGAAANVLCTYE